MEEKKQMVWVLPDDITIKETDKPEEILHKYLAEAPTKKWVENFTDEDTGEVTPIERGEMLFERGSYIDEDMFAKIMFHIQAGDIKTVKVCDSKPLNKRNDNPVRRYLVTLTCSFGGSCTAYVTHCKTPEDAAQLVSDYYQVYSLPEIIGNFAIVESTETNQVMIYPDTIGETECLAMRQATLKQAEIKVNNHYNSMPPIYDTERFWSISVAAWCEGPKKWEKSTTRYLVRAMSSDDAMIMLHNVLESADEESRNIYDFTSVSKSNVIFAIPKSYIQRWCEHNYGSEYWKYGR